LDAWPVALSISLSVALLAAVAWLLVRASRERTRLEQLERRNAWLERRVVQWHDGERRLFDSGPVVVLQLDAAAPHALRSASANLQRVLGGTPPHASLGQPFARLLHPDDAASFAEVAAQALAAPDERVQRELRLWHDGGSWRWVLAQFIADNRAEAPALRGYLVGIDALKQAESQAAARRRDLEALVQKMSASQRFLQGLQQLGEQLQQCDDEAQAGTVLARGGPALFGAWDGALSFSDSTGQMELAAAWGDYPRPHASREADCWALRRGRLHHASGAAAGRDRTPVCAHLAEHGALPDGVTHALCMPLLTPTGRPGALHLLTRATLDEEQVRTAGWAAEATAETLKLSLANLQLRLSLQEQAVRDWLTGLYNRRHFDDAMKTEIDRAQRAGDRLTLALLDIDHFKQFNDTYGHEAGDEVLKGVAGELRRFVRSYDTASRIGGEELALLLPRAALEETCARLDRLRENIGRLQLQHDGVELPRVSVSIGVADLAQGDAAHLLHRADVALYAAKHAGRNRLERWRPELDDQVLATPTDAAMRRRRRDEP
jgi:diguanylate cyclase (GGDEF)-like protein